MVYGVLGLVVGLVAGYLIDFFMKRTLIAEKDSRINELTTGMADLKRESNQLGSKIGRLEREIQKHRDLAILFPELAKQILWARSSEELSRYIARAVNRLTGCDKIAVFVADKPGKRLALIHGQGLDDVLKPPLVVKVGEGHIGFAAETGQFMTKEAFEDQSTLVKKQVESTALENFVPDIVAPMVGQGVLYGVVCLCELPLTANLPEERVRAVASIGAASLENVRLLDRFVSAADLDSETGLPGMTSLHDKLEGELERVRRFNSPLSILELSIPQAKSDNRFLAREVMLIGSGHLKSTLRNIDIGIRTSRDKLLLLLPGTDREGLANVVERLGEDMPRLQNEDGQELGPVEIRSLFVPEGTGMTAEEVLDKIGEKGYQRFEA